MKLSSAVSALLLSTSTRLHRRSSLTAVSSFLLTPPSIARGTVPTSSLSSPPRQLSSSSTTTVGAKSSCPTFVRPASKTAMRSASTDVEEATETKSPVEVFREDYLPSPYTIPSLSMDFKITPDEGTIVTTTLNLTPNPLSIKNDDGGSSPPPLVLDGDATSITLLSVTMDGTLLTAGVDYTVSGDKLIIQNPGRQLETAVKIHPESNTQLSGLYQSSGMYCTQCEAMGFRRITYYLDRPDVMAVFDRVRVEAPREGYPVLLSNGNLVEEGEGDDGRHYVVWSDPYPKPSYLFALVAGNLDSIEDRYTTSGGRDVKLEIFSEKDNVDKLDHAMSSLKKSMEWDEQRFGLEYDLDLYNIVAVNDFNMGAMENKGLNVFNTAYVLASPKTATDGDFLNVEAVIGHEYFHNWTGNRVTCRDWFQLTLKEGLTVFRDQEFSADMIGSQSVKRIEDVVRLRGAQFKEDASPMKHPIRPERYISMDNFYTSTVYSKGAEVIRMYQTLLSREGFRKGMDLYFQRHDGTAVTCDDFLSAMADANNADLSQFSRWYSTPGTPTVTYSSSYDNGTLTLTFRQTSLSTQGPLHIPISVGVLDGTTGEEVAQTKVLELKEEEQSFTFDNLKAESVVPSLLRDFSAPVKLVADDTSTQELEWSYLAAHDTDGYNKWDAGQKLYTQAIFKTLSSDETSETTLQLVEDALRGVLASASEDGADYSLTAYALTLPGESTLAEDMTPPIDPVALHKARGTVKKRLARQFNTQIQNLYDSLTTKMQSSTASSSSSYAIDSISMGQRRLRNVLLDYLTTITETAEELNTASDLAYNHFQTASGMTDKMAALNALVGMDTPHRDDALRQFYDDANGDPLVINKWFTVQALADVPDVLDKVEALTKHVDFTLSNPNRCRSLVGAFCMNESHFHAADGKGYRFLGSLLGDIDELNPQLSSRIGKSLIGWKRYDEDRARVMKEELEKLKGKDGLSDDLFEIVSRGLK